MSIQERITEAHRKMQDTEVDSEIASLEFASAFLDALDIRVAGRLWKENVQVSMLIQPGKIPALNKGVCIDFFAFSAEVSGLNIATISLSAGTYNPETKVHILLKSEVGSVGENITKVFNWASSDTTIFDSDTVLDIMAGFALSSITEIE